MSVFPALNPFRSPFIALALLLSLRVSYADAQTFQVIPEGRVLTLDREEEATDFLYIRVDSTTLESGDSILHFGRFIGDPDGLAPTCAFAVGDTGFLGARMVVRSDGFHLFFNSKGDTIFYYPDHGTTGTWRFYTYPNGDHLDAQPWVFTTQGLLPGFKDSIKVVLLTAQLASGPPDPSNPYHAQPLGLTENNGIFRWFDLHHFPNTGGPVDWFWGGLSDPDTGVVQIDAADVFDLQPGNEIHYEHELVTTDIEMLERYKHFVLARRESADGDTIELDVFRALIRYSFDPINLTYDTVRSLDTIIEVIPLADYAFLDALPSEQHQWSMQGYSELIRDTLFFGRLRKKVYDFYDLDPVEGCLILPPGSVPEYTFMDGLGLFHYFEEGAVDPLLNFERVDVLFYQKGLDSWGERLDFDSLLATGLASVDGWEPRVRLYPNPASEWIRLDVEGRTAGLMQVMDATGRIRVQQECRASGLSIDLAALPPGIYWIRWSDEQGSFSRSFLKQ